MLRVQLPLPWGAPRSAVPRWAPACGLRRCFLNQRPPRAAHPWPQPPGRSAEPSRDPVAGSPAAGARARSDGLFGKPRISLFSAGPDAPISHRPPSPHRSGCSCSAGSLREHSIVRGHVSCPSCASLESKGEAFLGAHSMGKGETSFMHTHPRCRRAQPPSPPQPLLPAGPTKAAQGVQLRTPQDSNGPLLRQ